VIAGSPEHIPRLDHPITTDLEPGADAPRAGERAAPGSPRAMQEGTMLAVIETRVAPAKDEPTRQEAPDRRPTEPRETQDDRPRTFLEALRRMLGSIHS
jgi:hypothetical protein